MKRVGGLWDELVSWENLALALRRAAAGKRRRPDVAAFLLDWEPRVAILQRELKAGAYTPGPYRTFRIWEPKPRWISAAPFRDRIVHHALTQVMEPVFERRFSPHSYACRQGFGTHKALDAASAACARFPFVLQCDIRKYFPSIDHEILKDLLARVVKCPPTLNLAAAIIDGYEAPDTAMEYFPGDDMFTPTERRRGLPLGNQTSQFFANVYLNGLDQFVLRDLRPGAYCRYVDDFLLFAASPTPLHEARARIEALLDRLRLRVHEGKSQVRRVDTGIAFLGWRILPGTRRLARRNVVSFRRRLRRMQADYAKGQIGWNHLLPRLRSWNAHAAHGNTWRLRARIFEGFASAPARL